MTRKQRVSNSPQNRDVNATKRAVLAVELRAQRLTYQEIADRVGYGSPTACRDAILRELSRVVVSAVEHLRTEELDMLNRMHSECWQLFMDKSNRSRLFAADRLISISEARRKLMGMDIKPDELLANQNYIKKIILVTGDESSTGGQSANTNNS